jgi:hypothetical protein
MSFSEEIAKIVNGDGSFEEKKAALKKLGLTETDVYNMPSMAKFLPEPKVVKTKERGEYPVQPFHADNIYPTLSVKQPWASLCCTVKDVENRTWEPGYIGKLLIHASQNIDRQAMEDLQLRPKVNAALGIDYQMSTSCIVGCVDLVDCVNASDSEWAVCGNLHWILRNPVLFRTPVFGVRGQLRLFDTELDLEAKLKEE